VSFTIIEPSPVALTVHDLSGRVVFAKSWNSKASGQYEESVSLNNTRGMYLLKLKTGKGQRVQKIVIRE
jgi:hypothetical protein